jgi:cation diffusion facilitator family transporter
MADGLTSLAVVGSALGVWLGYTWADPLIGLLITAMLLKIVWESGQNIFTRLLDGVDPEVIYSIQHAVEPLRGVEAISSIRARWMGHRLLAEVDVVVAGDRSIQAGQAIAETVQAQLQDSLPYLSHPTIRIIC